jgi:hypothetical protein
MLWIVWLPIAILAGALLFLFRIGHLVETGRVRRVLRKPDRRGKFVLYLRGFDADAPWNSSFPIFHWGLWGIISIFRSVGRHPAFALAARFERFIKDATQSVLGDLPLVAVGANGQVLGIGRVVVDPYEWKPSVASLCEDARSIIFLVGGSAGLTWELAHLVEAQHLHKTVFVIPPWDIMERQYGAARRQ